MVELNKNYERSIIKYCENFKVDFDLLDYKSLWDNKISKEENLNNIKLIIEDMSNNRIEGQFKINKRSIKQEKEEADRINLKNIQKQEEYIKQEFNKTLEEIKKTDNLNFNFYKIPTEYIKSVIRGFNKSFIFIGKAGIGKTYLTRQVLSQEKAKFVENVGVNSPMALYQFLYENNKKDLILVFDDTYGLINNPSAYNILLNVLWEGFAEWNTTSEKLKIPKKFKFEGKIIFITNKLNNENSDIMKSRCLVYNLNLKNIDIIKIMYSIAKQKHKKLNKEERFKIVDFIKENSDNSIINLDLRMQYKTEQLYLYDKENWEELSKPLFEKDNNLYFLMSCIKSGNTMKEAQENWSKETGKSRRSFYLYKKEIENLKD